ncbi:MAG: DinB family protein [Chloroflexi bacterium]|nr:DinB family protein [Chloroflexota bacterium]
MSDVELLFLLERSRRELYEACLGMSDLELRTRPAQDEWTVVEVLAHLPDVDRHYLQEALTMLAEDQHLFRHFDDEAWKVTHADVLSLPLSQIFGHLRVSHDEITRAVELLSSQDLERAGIHPRRGRYTVRDVFLRLPDHDLNHAHQIRAIRDAVARSSSCSN